MARFRVRDLMIQLPQQAELQAPGAICWFTCHWFTPCHWFTCHWLTPHGCWPFLSCPNTIICGPFSPDPCGVISPYVGVGPGEIVQPEDLAALKAQLQRALANIEEQEKALEERDRPQTLEQVEALEEKLKGALEELAARKAELGKQSGKSK